jgi:hypothetical protein
VSSEHLNLRRARTSSSQPATVGVPKPLGDRLFETLVARPVCRAKHTSPGGRHRPNTCNRAMWAGGLCAIDDDGLEGQEGCFLLCEPAWDPRVLLTLETRMEHEQETTDVAVPA